MNELEMVIEAIEHGLLTVKSPEKRPGRKKELLKRMEYHKVPGFSAALIDQGELV